MAIITKFKFQKIGENSILPICGLDKENLTRKGSQFLHYYYFVLLQNSATKSVLSWEGKVFWFYSSFPSSISQNHPHIHRCLFPFSPRHLKSTREYPFLVSHMKLFMATSPAVSWNLVMIHPLKFNQEYWRYIELMVWSLLKTQSRWDSILFSHKDNGQPDSEG